MIVYSYMTMMHPVVRYTLDECANVKVIYMKGYLSIAYIFFHVIFACFFRKSSRFNFQYPNYRYLPAVLFLKIMRKEYSVSLWGSDYYKSKGWRGRIVSFILKNAKKISIATNESKEYVVLKFGFCNLVVLPFLIPNLENISKSENGKEKRKKTILCGTNGSPNQQLDIIISALKKSEDFLKDQYKLIFHLAYGGDEDNFTRVNEFAKETRIEVEVVEDYFYRDDLIVFRESIDILVQIQKTDQLSAAMFEHLVQNKLVITGSWLPYSVLREMGVKFISLSEVNLVEDLSYTLSTLDSLRKWDLGRNRDIILSEFGRSTSKEKWHNFLT